MDSLSCNDYREVGCLSSQLAEPLYHTAILCSTLEGCNLTGMKQQIYACSTSICLSWGCYGVLCFKHAHVLCMHLHVATCNCMSPYCHIKLICMAHREGLSAWQAYVFVHKLAHRLAAHHQDLAAAREHNAYAHMHAMCRLLHLAPGDACGRGACPVHIITLPSGK